MSLDERARAELLAMFQAEMAEHCQTLTRAFLSLEKEPEPTERHRLLDEAFRAAHNLKGAARAVTLTTVEALAHGLEGVLGAVKRDELDLSPSHFDLLYATVDALGSTVGEDDAPSLPDDEAQELLGQLRAAHTTKRSNVTRAGAESAPAAASPTPAAPPLPARSSAVGSSRPVVTGGTAETIRLPAARLDALLEQLGELLVPRLGIADGLSSLTTVRERLDRWQREWRRVRPLLRQLERAGALAGVRPLVRYLERSEETLLAVATELGDVNARLAPATIQIEQLTDGLQVEVKRLRMLPFGNLAEMLERTVRDLARSLGKEARLILVGADTELDRQVLEGMKDPLLHLVRNAVDHGLEPADERQRRGKPAIGSVIVTAAQRGGTIAVEVEDDGAGLDLDVIRQAAIEREPTSAAEVAAMSDDEVRRLIFRPGLSTRRDVSAVSGRGVGLDVVARAVEDLNGRIEIDGTPGRGVRFAIMLPLTLATMRAVLVEAGGALYALPTSAVERIRQVESLGSLGGRPTLEHEGSAMPVAPLATLLDGGGAPESVGAAGPRTLVLVGVGTQRVALAIDRVVGEQEIVVRPLGFPLVRVRRITGATILGSGRVVPILNMADVVQAAVRSSAPSSPRPMEAARRRTRVLIADDSLTTRTLERYILEAAGYDVALAGDGAEALSLLQEGDYDVLVSDVNMPNLDGIALAARLRQEPRFRTLPIVLVTSLASDEDRQRGLEAGADAYIVKSAFDQDHLLSTIRDLI